MVVKWYPKAVFIEGYLGITSHFHLASGYVNSLLLENDPVEIVDFPIKNGDFHHL